jgi:hypothetical protein
MRRVKNRETFRGKEYITYNSWTKFYHILYVTQSFGTTHNKANETVETFGDKRQHPAIDNQAPLETPDKRRRLGVKEAKEAKDAKDKEATPPSKQDEKVKKMRKDFSDNT